MTPDQLNNLSDLLPDTVGAADIRIVVFLTPW